MRKLITISLLVVSFCAYGQKAKGPVMHWREYSAKDEAYPASDYFPVDKEKIFCYLSNNDSSIYIDLIIPNPGVSKLILTTGMNIWIDLSGKEVKAMGVRYPQGSDNVKAVLQRKGEAMTNSEKLMFLHNSSLEMAYEIEVAGFGEGIPPVVPSKGGAGFGSSVRYSDDGNLLYRMVMPANSIVLQEVKGKVVPISIGIEYGASRLPRPQVAGPGGATPRPSGAGPGGGGGARGGPGGGGGAPGGSMGASAPQVPVEPVWIKGLMPAKK